MAAARWLRVPLAGVLSAVTMAMVLVGCSSGQEATPSSSAAAAPSTVPAQAGISPGGVTTSVIAQAESTQSEYSHACHAAREWMSQKPGDPHDHVEPYLAMVQASPTGSEGTWGMPWNQMTPERQAALIYAVNSAADGGCPA